MNGNWILIADTTEVRLFSRKAGDTLESGSLALVKCYRDPLAKESNKSMLRHEAGREMHRGGALKSGRFSVLSSSSPKDEATRQFARSVMKDLQTLHSLGRFASLSVIAEPRFLGQLKGFMSPQLKRHFVAWVKMDLGEFEARELHELLQSEGFGNLGRLVG